MTEETLKGQIIWLENPRQWRYLREGRVTRGSRRGFKRGVKLPMGDFYKLVGYQLIDREGPGIFLYRIYWLKTYDSGCPRGYEVYKDDGSPCEAVDVKDLLSTTVGRKRKA